MTPLPKQPLFVVITFLNTKLFLQSLLPQDSYYSHEQLEVVQQNIEIGNKINREIYENDNFDQDNDELDFDDKEDKDFEDTVIIEEKQDSSSDSENPFQSGKKSEKKQRKMQTSNALKAYTTVEENNYADIEEVEDTLYLVTNIPPRNGNAIFPTAPKNKYQWLKAKTAPTKQQSR